MVDSFKTISKKVENIIFKERGSKFINYAFPVETEDEIKAHLQELREKYPNATHHCYAYSLGMDENNYKANDDGEPNGTAGLPIYNQILSNELTDILIVSIRYYGGTKLGVSGLIKAYKLSAQLVLEESEIIEKYITHKFGLKFSYEDQGMVLRNIDIHQAEIKDREYTEYCYMEVSIRKTKAKAFLASFEPLFNVKIEKL